VFHGYQNLLNETSYVVVHEWVLNLNIRLEIFNFHIVGIFDMMHCCCLETTLYVPMTRAFFQYTIQTMCKFNVPKYQRSIMGLKNGFLHMM
jgi:hypothetical protein